MFFARCQSVSIRSRPATIVCCPAHAVTLSCGPKLTLKAMSPARRPIPSVLEAGQALAGGLRLGNGAARVRHVYSGAGSLVEESLQSRVDRRHGTSFERT